MKKISILLVLLAAICIPSMAQTKNQISVSPKVDQFLAQACKGDSISYFYTHKDDGRTETEIMFHSRTKLTFSAQGDLIEAENRAGIALTILPKTIADFVQAKYPNVAVKEYEKKYNKQTVDLVNGMELEFDLAGKFLRIDD